MATLIYNDRIATWKRMKAIDKELDQKPTARDVATMVELRIRNNQCFSELDTLNRTGKLRYVHPLIRHHSEANKLKELLKHNPEEFLRLHKNILNNIRRYTGYLRRTDRQEYKESDRKHLKEYRERESLFRTILQQKDN